MSGRTVCRGAKFPERYGCSGLFSILSALLMSMAHVRLLCTFQLGQVLYDEASLIVLRSDEVGHVYLCNGKAAQGAPPALH